MLFRRGCAVFLLLVSARCSAQFVQYSAAGSVGSILEVGAHGTPEQAAAEARWRLGPLRLDPVFVLRDLAYVDTADPNDPMGGAATADFTGTGGAGLRAYLRTGRKIVWLAEAGSSYVWWSRSAERRARHDKLRLQFAGHFNRLAVDLEASTVGRQENASTEIELPVGLREQSLSGSMELRLLRRLSLVGTASGRRWDYREQGSGGDELTLPDRQELRVGGALRYRPGGSLQLDLGLERSRTELEDPEDRRSTTGTSLNLGVALGQRRVGLRGSLSLTALDGAESEAGDTRQATGRGVLAWKPGARLEAQVYASRSLSFSVLDAASLVTDARLGAAVFFPVRWRLGTGLFAEAGSRRPRRGGALEPDIADRLLAFGAHLDVRLGEKVGLLLRASHEQLRSDDPTRDREVLRIQTSLVFGRDRREARR